MIHKVMLQSLFEVWFLPVMSLEVRGMLDFIVIEFSS